MIKDFKKHNGIGLTQQYGSYINLIMNNFPNYNWLPWKFNSVPDGFWSDSSNAKKYINWLANELKVNTMEDWYKVSWKVTIETLCCHGNNTLGFHQQ